MPSASRHLCKDCAANPPSNTPRPAPHPGPRCATHHRARAKALKSRTTDTRAQKVYGMRPGEYEKLLLIQGGKCAICQRATGKKRALAVDHDHAREAEGRESVRALLCKHCNYVLIGRHDAETLRRGADILDGNTPFGVLYARQVESELWDRLVGEERVVLAESGCWVSERGTDSNGYAAANLGYIEGRRVQRLHRIAYAQQRGISEREIPREDGDGNIMALDHVRARGCITKRCFNPAHLEFVTMSESSRRATPEACARGHRLLGANRRANGKNAWTCLMCGRARAKRAGKRWAGVSFAEALAAVERQYEGTPEWWAARGVEHGDE